MADIQKLFQQAVASFRAGQFSSAEQQFRHLLRFNAKHPDILHILALCLQNQHQPKAAADYLQTALRHNSSHAPSRKSLISLYIQQGNFAGAQAECDTLREQQPEQFEPYLLQAQLYRTMGLTDGALEAIEKARLKLAKPLPIVDYYLACIHYDLAQYEQTEAILQNLVSQIPDYIDAHIALNKLYWEHGPQEKFLTSITKALERLPQSRELRYSLAAHLLMSNQPQACLESCEETLKDLPDGAEFHHLKGSAFMRLERLDDAVAAYEQALKLQPDVLRHRIDYATTMMRLGEYETALQNLKAVEKFHPHSQEALAYKALCLHALGRAEADALNNYDQFVKIIPLQAPQAYANTEQFMAELAQALKGLHKTQQQPLDQSVRHGTQTVGNLFAQKLPIIAEFEAMIEAAAAQYVSGLPNSSSHPFLQRKSQGTRFTGAWSVRLAEKGFHSNHVHPEGWISCCTYIQLPPQVQPDDANKAGWIQFGDPGMPLPNVKPKVHAVCPKVGYCVFFPSYFFHGTVPFQGDGIRMTAPCDISPAW